MRRATKCSKIHLQMAMQIKAKPDTEKDQNVVKSFVQTANTVEQRVIHSVQGPVLDLVSQEQEANPQQNSKLVVKIGDLVSIKAMLKRSELCTVKSENMDFINGKVIDILHRQCLSEAKEFSRTQQNEIQAKASNSNDDQSSSNHERQKSNKPPVLALVDKYREAIYFLFT